MDVPAILAAIKSLETTIDSYFSATNNNLQEIQSSLDTYSTYLHRTSSDLQSKIPTPESDVQGDETLESGSVVISLDSSSSSQPRQPPPPPLLSPSPLHLSRFEPPWPPNPSIVQPQPFPPPSPTPSTTSPPPVPLFSPSPPSYNSDLPNFPSIHDQTPPLPRSDYPWPLKPYPLPSVNVTYPPPPPPISPQPPPPPFKDKESDLQAAVSIVQSSSIPKLTPKSSPTINFINPQRVSHFTDLQLTDIADPDSAFFQPTPPPPVRKLGQIGTKRLTSIEIDKKREQRLCVVRKWSPLRPCHRPCFWLVDTKDWCDFDLPERPLCFPGSFIPHSLHVMLGGEPPPMIPLIWNREHKLQFNS